MEINAIEVLEHFGLSLEKSKETKYQCDFTIYKKEGFDKLSDDLFGFGTKRSHTLIIDYDKDYGYVLVREEVK